MLKDLLASQLAHIDHISGWPVVPIAEKLEVDLDLGIEIRVVYDASKQVSMIFSSSITKSSFLLSLQYWTSTFEGCQQVSFHMDGVKNGNSITLKIYRKEGNLMIDVNDVNKNKIHIDSEETCSSFWGSEISEVYFAEESRDVATHYRMVAENTDIRNFDPGILI